MGVKYYYNYIMIHLIVAISEIIKTLRLIIFTIMLHVMCSHYINVKLNNDITCRLVLYRNTCLATRFDGGGGLICDSPIKKKTTVRHRFNKRHCNIV